MDSVACSYVGGRTADGRRFDGLGRYTFANGDVYIGGMQDGQLHGKGVIFFRRSTLSTCSDSHAKTGIKGSSGISAAAADALHQARTGNGADRGDDGLRAFLNPSASVLSADSEEVWSGQYRGVWEHGRHVKGQYVFDDGLVYGNDEADALHHISQQQQQLHFPSTAWSYCDGADRRLWAEYLENVAPVLPHEALLGGAKVLQERKHALAAATTARTSAASEEGEGLPLVLPNAFVQARTAPAFAAGQLVSVHDPRVTRWTAAAMAADEVTRQDDASTSPEMIESTVALQLAVSHSTTNARTQEHADEGEAETEKEPAGVAGAAAHAKLNLSVCRVKDVEDVNRALVKVIVASS